MVHLAGVVCLFRFARIRISMKFVGGGMIITTNRLNDYILNEIGTGRLKGAGYERIFESTFSQCFLDVILALTPMQRICTYLLP